MKFFTKKELKVIALIFLGIALVSMPNFRISLRRQRDLQRKNDIGDIAKALDKYHEDFGIFPLTKDLPRDPDWKKGLVYVYISNGRRFQILASLEGRDEDEYSPRIEERNIKCGLKLCNFGRAYGKTPLDKSIEEYENEINAKN